jgi:hypothetical protein
MDKTDNIKAMLTIEARRRFIGMTLADLCGRADIAPNTYRTWAKRGTSLFNIKRLGDALADFAKENKL